MRGSAWGDLCARTQGNSCPCGLACCPLCCWPRGFSCPARALCCFSQQCPLLSPSSRRGEGQLHSRARQPHLLLLPVLTLHFSLLGNLGGQCWCWRGPAGGKCGQPWGHSRVFEAQSRGSLGRGFLQIGDGPEGSGCRLTRLHCPHPLPRAVLPCPCSFLVLCACRVVTGSCPPLCVTSTGSCFPAPGGVLSPKDGG